MAVNNPCSDGVEPDRPVTILPRKEKEKEKEKSSIEYEASAAGDLATVNRILDQWDKGFGRFSVALYRAIENGHLSVAANLFEHGVEVEAHHFQCAVEQRAFPFMQLFLDHRYNINSPDYRANPGIVAENIDDEHLTRSLLDHGADPTAERICIGQKMGETAVSFVMGRAPWSTIQLLLERGGPEILRCGQLLWFATARRLPDHLEVMEYLLKNGAAADLRSLEFEDRPEAARQADWVLGRGTPLHTAARNECLDAVILLIAWGADPAQPDSKGRLPIDEAKMRYAISHTKDYLRHYVPGDQEGVIAYFESLAGRTEPPAEVSKARLERL
ncbi:MAG: hypothetical protein Q9200_000767 [Gallowayella weberi]